MMESKDECWHMSAPNYSTDLSQIRSDYRPQGQYEQVRRKKSLTPTSVQAPDCPTWSKLLFQLHFPGPPHLQLKL